jgi:hypothetical protein
MRELATLPIKSFDRPNALRQRRGTPLEQTGICVTFEHGDGKKFI